VFEKAVSNSRIGQQIEIIEDQWYRRRYLHYGHDVPVVDGGPCPLRAFEEGRISRAGRGEAAEE